MLDLKDRGPVATAKRGECLGVTYSLHNGLLDVQLQEHQAIDLLEFLRAQMKTVVRKENVPTNEYVWVHRMSRMCFELAMDCKITGIDKLEGELLYEAPQEEKFEWIFKLLNGLRGELRSTGCSIVVADHVAKSIEDIMTS